MADNAKAKLAVTPSVEDIGGIQILTQNT